MFLNTIMLAGIAGAALPLVVHLLSRARVRTVDWGAMMFLEEGRGTQEQAARLKQWTLLLIRMGTVALLAIAMARPIVVGRWAGPAGPVTAVIVVDTSASMAQPTGSGRTRADAAREAVLRILSNIPKGGRAGFIFAGGGARAADVQPSADLQAVAARAAELKPGTGAADVAAALNAAADMLDRHAGVNGRLYLITDGQASSWQGTDEPFGSSWRTRTTRAGRRLPFDVVTVADAEAAENVAVESIDLLAPQAIAGLASEVEVTVRNRGATPRPQVPLNVRSDKRELFSGTIDLAAGAAASVTVPVIFDAPGQQSLAAEITSGTLASDDRMQHVIDVVAPPRVLIVSGDERGGAGSFRAESDFLRTALAPFAAMKRPAVDPARVTVLPIDQWADAKIADADVLMLANVAELTPQQVRSVESFVYAGGGLLVAPGGTTRAESYNRALYRNAAGVLPASLSGPSSEQPTSLLGIDLSHPIFRFLRGRPDPIPSAVVARTFAATPRAGAAAVLASYVTGQPFLVEGAYGRGRVLLMTTTIDADWNTLPLSSFYLPFAQSAVRYLAAAAMPQRNLAPGQELRARFADAPANDRATATTPSGRRIVLEVAGYDGNYEAATADTGEPGLYTLRATVGGRDRVDRYFVRQPAAESDLKPLSDADWSRLQRLLAFRRTTPGLRALLPSATGSAGAEGRELWLTVLLGAMALVGLELVLARLWSEAR